MEENLNEQSLTKKERKQLRREEKLEERARREKQSSFFSEWKAVAIPLFFALVIIGGGFWWFHSSQKEDMSSSSAVSKDVSGEKKDWLKVVPDDWIKGNKEAKVVVIEYLDFECEACGAYYPLVKRLSEEYGDRVAFVSRYFPLPGHKNSMTAARAVEAAGKQDKYWEMYDALFQDQKSWSEKPRADAQLFEGYAEKLGLDMGRFRQDVDSKEIKERIERDRKVAEKLKAEGTPTFFLGSEKIANPRGYDDFKSLLEKELNQ